VKVVVDRTKCGGIGICEGLDPERFQVHVDGKVRVLRESLEDDEAVSRAREAVQMCPTESLTMVD
jgi:ferredoxin